MPTTSPPPADQPSAPSAAAAGSNSPVKRISRRRFGCNAAVIAAVSISPAGLLTLARPQGPPSDPAPGAHDNKLDLTADQRQEVEARLANIIRKYGDRLSEKQRQHLRRILSYNESMLAPIRRYSLQNSDAPATVLKLAVGEHSFHTAPKSEGNGK